MNAFKSDDYIQEALKIAHSIDGVASSTPLINVDRVGIIGGGTMGGGIAMNFANIGIPVHIIETKQDALARGLAVIHGHYKRSASKGRFPAEEVDLRMNRITGSLDMTDLANCDLIIEAVFEDIDLKIDIFRRLDGIAKPGAILASNTSGLDVNAIAAATARPEAVIGLHFFSPANVMKLVEIVRGAKTSEVVLATSMDVARRIGKVAVVVGVCPGFVGNRMLYPRQIQARELLKRGARPWDIDRVLKEFGFKMGPFEMSDLAGLDIGWSKGVKTDDPLRDALCESGRFGQKNNKGFYDYDENRIASPSPEVDKLIEKMMRTDTVTYALSDQEILETCLFPMINEGAKILEEKMAQRPSDIDLVWLYGYNWPKETGGPMRWADTVGLERVEAMASRLGAENSWYSPAALLSRLVATGHNFSDL